MTEILTIGEKGQIVIPKKVRESLHMEKGTKLMLTEEKDRIIIRAIVPDEEKYALLMLSEASLKKIWDNPYDKRWDDVL